MQSVSSRIWTRVAVFISYDDNHYTMGNSLNTTGTSFPYTALCTVYAQNAHYAYPKTIGDE